MLSGHDFEIKEEDFKNKDYIIGHYGLTPIPYSKKTFSILRNPAQRSFSYMKYVWEWHYADRPIEEVFNFFLTDKNFREALSNQQSKFLTQSTNLEEYNNNIDDMNKHVMSGWSLIHKDIDKNSVLDSIIKNNIEVLFFEDKDLYKKVFDILKLGSTENIDFYKKTNESKNFEPELYEKYHNELCEINILDIEVYNILKEKTK